MSIQPEGEDIRKAVKWICECRETNPEISISKLLDEACRKFDLSPLEANFLSRTICDKETQA